MKLTSKKKRTKATLIVLAVVVAIIAIIGTVLLLISKSNQDNEKEPGEITDIQFSAYPNKSTYYIGEEFDPTGVRVQVLTYDYDLSYFVDHTKLSFSGFDSSEANDALPITVSYKGFTTSFNIKIIEPQSATPTLTSYEVCNLKTEYPISMWNEYGIDVVGATLKFVYSDGSTKEDIYIQKHWFSGITKVDAPCELEVIIQYDDGGTLREIPVKITITE